MRKRLVLLTVLSLVTVVWLTSAQDTLTRYNTFVLQPEQARAVRTLLNAIDAYNDGDIEALSALVTEDVLWSDCDYARGLVVNFESLESLIPWLSQRFAEHDRFEIGSFFNQNSQAIHLGVGVQIVRRTSDSITAKGRPDGVEPLLSPKVSFTPDGTRITRFANGPVGGTIRCTV